MVSFSPDELYMCAQRTVRREECNEEELQRMLRTQNSKLSYSQNRLTDDVGAVFIVCVQCMRESNRSPYRKCEEGVSPRSC